MHKVLQFPPSPGSVLQYRTTVMGLDNVKKWTTTVGMPPYVLLWDQVPLPWWQIGGVASICDCKTQLCGWSHTKLCEVQNESLQGEAPHSDSGKGGGCWRMLLCIMLHPKYRCFKLWSQKWYWPFKGAFYLKF